jgi:hypothetical protein
MSSSAPKIAVLSNTLKGKVVVPGDAAHDDARQIWNAMIALDARGHGAAGIGARVCAR